MKKIFDKKILYGVIIGIIITSGISVLAANYLYKSEDVSYDGTKTDKTNVKDALEDLYSIANSKIKDGDELDVTVYNLGGVGTYQISTLYPNIDYTKLTSNNFYVKVNGLSISGNFRLDNEKRSSGSSPSAGPVKWSYNASTGTLSSSSTSGGGIYYNGGSGEAYAYASASASVFMVIPTNAIK